MNNFGSLATKDGLAIFYNGQMWNVSKDHPNFETIRTAIDNKDYDSIPGLIDITKTVTQWFIKNTNVEVKNGIIWFDGKPVPERTSQKALDMIAAGNSAEPLIRFLMKVRQNPSYSSQEELLLFLQANNFMIHEDGDILAYKSVRADYTDIHSGKFLNNLGAIHQVPRSEVDDNRHNTCSKGFHFAAYQYASTWAGGAIGHLMLLKIHPADVVSIPNDYNNQKGRCCRYEVIAELPLDKKLPEKEVYTDSILRREASNYYTSQEDDSDACDCELCRPEYVEDDDFIDCTICNDDPSQCDCGDFCINCGEPT